MQATGGIDWSPTIGDPTIAGWLTVISYFAAAAFCYSCARVDGANQRIWTSLGIFELLLGINKQLDLQVLVTEVGRYLAKQEAWYQDRRDVQLVFIAAMVVLFAALIIAIHGRARARPAAVRMALLGASIELVFVATRAASFHHVDAFLNSRFMGAKANVLLENFGILILVAGAWATLDSRRLPKA